MKKVILAINFVLFSSVLGMVDWASEWFEKAEIMELLGEIKPDRKQFEWLNAARSGNLATIDRMIKNGMDLNVKDMITGDTALIIAAQNENPKMVERIIKGNTSEVRGMVIERKNSGRKLSDQSISRWMDRVFTNVNARDNNGNTALMDAAADGYENIVRLLIDNNADVNAKDKGGYTALMMAAAAGCENIVRLLIDNHADVNARNKCGYTALMDAREDGYYGIVRLLRSAGAKD